MPEASLFQYQDLNPPEDAIRLLTLLPGSISDDVHLLITHKTSQDQQSTPYECLSYTWGSADQPLEKVFISEELLANSSDINSTQYHEVRINLLTALKYIRLRDAPRVIWIDAICINQQDPWEKSRQVARMGQIYKDAAQVLAWLGPEDESTHMALGMIDRLSAGIELSWNHRSMNTIAGSEAEVVGRCNQASNFTPQHWESLTKFIERPWFERLWIRQEVLLASRVIVRCGFAEIEWSDIEKVIIFVEHRVSRAHVKTGDVLLCRSLFPYVGSDSLTYTLHRSSFCKCFDSRDLVYANLSTSSAMKELHIEPDYSETVANVFKNMTCKYIERFKNLDLFRLCDLQRLPSDFKSFVPNFARPKSESRLFSVYAHAGSRQSFVDSEGGNMEVKGRIVARVQNVSGFPKPISKATPSGDNHIKIIENYHRWEPEDLMTTKTYPLGGTLLDAFIMLLSNGFCRETYHMEHFPTIQESKESFLAAVWSGGDIDLIKDPRFKLYVSELKSDRRSEIFFQTVEGYIGASSADIQNGDIISILIGASVPIVLRPAIDHPDVYQVVGPCYLQGVMYGEALLGPLPEGWLCIIHGKQRWCFQKQGSEKKTWEDPRLWPLPSHWQIHFCSFDDDDGSCNGKCESEDEMAGQLKDRWFFNTKSMERSKDDPRLDLQGLEAGGIKLQSFILV